MVVHDQNQNLKYIQIQYDNHQTCIKKNNKFIYIN